MNDLARFKAMISKYHGNSDGSTNYRIVKTKKYTIIYLHTDDTYCNVEMWFDQNGTFRGFIDPEIYEED